MVIAQLVVGRGCAHDDPCGRIEAQHLLDDLIRVGEGGHIGRGGQTAAQDRGHLLAHALAHGRLLPQHHPCPRQQVGRRFVPRQKDGHGLVAQLLVAHPLACLFIAGGEEQTEQVGVVGGRASPLRYQPINNFVEGGDVAPVGAVAGQGQAPAQGTGANDARPSVAQQVGHGRGDGGHFGRV